MPNSTLAGPGQDPSTSQLCNKCGWTELNWVGGSTTERNQEKQIMSQEEPPAAREQEGRKSPAGATRMLHPQVKGQKQRRNPQTQAHLVPRCLYTPQAHTEVIWSWGRVPGWLRLGGEGWKRLRQQAPALPPPCTISPCLPVWPNLSSVFWKAPIFRKTYGEWGGPNLSAGHSDHPAHGSAPLLWAPRGWKVCNTWTTSSYQASLPREACRVI